MCYSTKHFNLKINIYIFFILKMIYPTIKWPLSHILIQARGMTLAKQLMETRQHV